jgi:hypothetical protein
MPGFVNEGEAASSHGSQPGAESGNDAIVLDLRPAFTIARYRISS